MSESPVSKLLSSIAVKVQLLNMFFIIQFTNIDIRTTISTEKCTGGSLYDLKCFIPTKNFLSSLRHANFYTSYVEVIC